MSLAFSVSTPSKKRPAPEDEFPEIDSENIDPTLFSPSKKSKGSDGSALKPHKPQQFILKANGTTSYNATPSGSASRAILTPKRLTLSTTATKPVSSAPAVAGRSPQKKKGRAGILSRRRISSSPFTRVDPPAFGVAHTSSTSNGLPFSIDAALSGTVPSLAPKPKAKVQHVEPATAPITDAAAVLEESMPNSWMFEIHEDTPDEELGNLMQHSTQTLDLSSDDEEKAREREDRGKENVPPAEALAMGRPASRKDVMTDEPRTPLGDLDAREFYAEGWDASSFVVVPGDGGEEETATKGTGSRFAFSELPAQEEEVRTPCPVDGTGESQDAWKTLLAQVDANAAAAAATTGDPDNRASVENGDENQPPIEIWESESAKDESEEPEQAAVTVTETLEESMRVAEANAAAVEQAL